jgi:hypothetical protein
MTIAIAMEHYLHSQSDFFPKSERVSPKTKILAG